MSHFSREPKITRAPSLLLNLEEFNKFDCGQSYLLFFSVNCSFKHLYFSDGK